MATKGEKRCEDIEEGGPRRCPSNAGESDGSLCFSDAEEQSWHSPYDSHRAGSSYEEFRLSGASGHDEIDGAPDGCRSSCLSDSSVEVDLETGVPEIKVDLAAKDAERDCRICHLSLESSAPESGVAIELGCSCKDDLAAAHKQCAETWFKIKGNKTCEICGSTARNVAGVGDSEVIEQWNETNNTTTAPAPASETRSFWQGHRFLNFLLACMVFAFVVSWLFHFNVPG